MPSCHDNFLLLFYFFNLYRIAAWGEWLDIRADNHNLPAWGVYNQNERNPRQGGEKKKSLCGSEMIDGILGEFTSVKVSTCVLLKSLQIEEWVFNCLH